MRELAVCSCGRRIDPPAALVDRVVDRADGVPFILEQIVLSTGTEGESPLISRRSACSRSSMRASTGCPNGQNLRPDAQPSGRGGRERHRRQGAGPTLADLQRDRRELELLEIVHRSTDATIRFRHALVAEASAETLPRPAPAGNPSCGYRGDHWPSMPIPRHSMNVWRSMPRARGTTRRRLNSCGSPACGPGGVRRTVPCS